MFIQFLIKYYSAGYGFRWAILGIVGAIFLGERLPQLRRDVFSKLPLIGDHWSSYRVLDGDGEDGAE